MKRLVGLAWTAFRCLLGLYFLVIGLTILRNMVSGSAGWVQPAPQDAAFVDAINASRFMLRALILAYVVGGIALIIPRTAPLGIAILGPTFGIIMLLHAELTGQTLWGVGWAVGLLLLAWRHRQAYAPLVNWRG